ncbi:MAG TPA: hypothetical protein VGD74_03735 [Vulgatibacter sp.]
MRTPATVLLAEALSVDAFSGRLTAFNILDAIVAPKVPAQFGKLTAAILYELSEESARFSERVSIRSADERTIAHGLGKIELVQRSPDGIPSTHRSLYSFWNLRIDSFSDHSIVVEQAESEAGPWIEVARRRVAVVEGLLPGQPAPLASPVLPDEARSSGE